MKKTSSELGYKQKALGLAIKAIQQIIATL